MIEAHPKQLDGNGFYQMNKWATSGPES